jgi:hypothetical protein
MLKNQEQYYGLTLGIVRDNDDPQQMGRLKVYIPSIDSKYYETKDLPWCFYITPFGGSIKDFKVGREETEIKHVMTYGIWQIPKVGAHVIVGFLDGNPQMRFWMGCAYVAEMNRSLPQALNDPGSKELRTEIFEPIPNPDDDDAYEGSVESEKIELFDKNLKEAGLGPDDDNFKTRGWERSVAYPMDNTDDKPDDDGYAKKPDGDEKDSQIYSITTPGRHFMTMSDVADHCRIRLKTTEGHQIIFDDTNERIYVSTAKGRNWVELDEDGRIFIYAKDEINVRSEDDINIKSEKNINIKAKKKINLQSEDDEINLQANKHIGMKSTDSEIKLHSKTGFGVKVDQGPIKLDSMNDIDITTTSGRMSLYSKSEFNLRSDNNVRITAALNVDLKSRVMRLTSQTSVFISAPSHIIIDCKIFTSPRVPKADPASMARRGQSVSGLRLKMVEPEKESWKRPDTKLSRNKNWKP